MPPVDLPPVDLRSDTVTRPSSGMRAAIAAAEVGDDVYGEDPTVRLLEERVAEMCGQQAGLFVASGSLGNQLGLRLACPPGGELICDDGAHVVTYELAAAAVLSGISTRTWSAPTGRPDPETVFSMVRDGGYASVPTRALSLEQTHNRSGGTIIEWETFQALTSGAHDRGLRVHVDGARLWNACATTGIAPVEYGRLADTMSVCLSKGLGAPVGSVLVGSTEDMATARVWRKRLGAGMRQAGFLAAAGLYALDHNMTRLADDHHRAARLADVLEVAHPHTNIVLIPVADANAAVAGAAAQGVLVSAFDAQTLRAVTHLDVDDAGLEHAVVVLSGLLGG